MRRLILVLAALAAVIVVGVFAFLWMRNEPDDEFEVCKAVVEVRLCGRHSDDFVRHAECTDAVAKKYRALRTPEERWEFLVNAGCAATHPSLKR